MCVSLSLSLSLSHTHTHPLIIIIIIFLFPCTVCCSRSSNFLHQRLWSIRSTHQASFLFLFSHLLHLCCFNLIAHGVYLLLPAGLSWPRPQYSRGHPGRTGFRWTKQDARWPCRAAWWALSNLHTNTFALLSPIVHLIAPHLIAPHHLPLLQCRIHSHSLARLLILTPTYEHHACISRNLA